MSLRDKAAFFQKELDQHHIAPDGQFVYKNFYKEDAAGKPVLSHAWGNMMDTCIWSGIHLAAESFRYAVTKSPEALRNVRRAAKSLHLLQAVHGIPGLLVRQVAPKGTTVDVADWWLPGTEEYPEWIWREDVSKDQYSGMVFGYGVACHLVEDEEVRKHVTEDLTGIADFLIRNRYVIVDHDGQPTKHGGLQAWMGPVPNGVQAFISLSAIKLAQLASGEPRFEQEYRRLVRKRWPQATWLVKVQLFGNTNHNNDNMAMLTGFPLILAEKDAKLRRRYVRSMRRTWKYVRHEGNAFWTFLYHGVGEKDPQALEDALLQMRNFPLSKRCFGVDNRGRDDVELGPFKTRKDIPKAKYPLPLNLRPQTSFTWKDCPYEMYARLGAKGTSLYAPVDYLVAYWAGRYYGLIKPED